MDSDRRFLSHHILSVNALAVPMRAFFFLCGLLPRFIVPQRMSRRFLMLFIISSVPLVLMGCQPSIDLGALFAFFSGENALDDGSKVDPQRPFAQTPSSSAYFDFSWPPRVGETYPDIPLLNENGQAVQFSQYRGNILLVAPIAMSSPGSQALAGGDRLGGLQGVVPQENIASIDQLISDFSKLSADDPRLIVLELLIYGPDRVQALPAHIAVWREHFHRSAEQADNSASLSALERGPAEGELPINLLPRARRVTVVPAVDMRGRESFDLIPGIQMVDKDGVLRFDATGAAPRHPLRTALLPALADYAARLSDPAGRYHIEWSNPSAENNMQ